MRDVPDSLPGHELVRAGLADLAAGRETAASLLVAMARPRLRELGFDVPAGGGSQPSHRLYRLLADSEQSPHSSYNALVRRVVSFVRASEHAAAG
jgi:hypothetical protein